MNRIVLNKSEFQLFFGLFALTILVVYFLPSTIKSFYFFVLLVIFFRSKKDFFWFAFILLIENAPGNLFPLSDPEHNLAILNLFGLRELYVQELFITVGIIKLIFHKHRYEKLFFHNNLKILSIYLIFLFVIGSYHGIETFKFLRSIRYILPFSLFLIIPAFFKKIEDYSRFFSLIFAAAIFVLLVQILELTIVKNNIASIFGGHSNTSFTDDTRLLYSPWLLTISLVGALFYLQYKVRTFNSNYLFIIIGAVILSFFLSATRGYTIAAISMLLFFLAFITIKRRKMVINGVLIISILTFTVIYNPTLSSYMRRSLNRLLTIEKLIEGDPTAGGTLGRITERRPRVINKFKENPIFGFGFSEEFYEYGDIHLGNETLLLKGGIVGYLLMILFWIYFNITLYKRNLMLSNPNLYKNTLLVFIIGFIGFFIIHSSSGYVFNYQIRYHSGMAIAVIILFTFADRVYKETFKNKNYNNLKHES